MAEKLVPALRFRGFDGEWEEKKLGEMYFIGNGKDYKHLGIGDIPVYGTGGYMLSVNTSICEKDSIGIGRKGTIDCPYILRAPFWTVDTLFFCTPKDGQIDFLIGTFQNIDWRSKDESTGVPSLSKKTIEGTITKIPNNFEQQKIGKFMADLDKLIAGQKQRIEKLKNFKKALLEKLFPGKGEKIPSLRFRGFDGEWEEAFIKDIASITTGKSNTQDQVSNGKYPFFIRSDIPVRSDKYLFDCEAVITIGDGQIGKVFHYINGKFDLHQRCYKIADFEKIQGKYFYYYFSANFYDRAMKMTAKATVDSVRMDMIADMQIFKPSSSQEQKQISNLLDDVCRLLELCFDKLAKLQNMKQACLRKMFV